MNCDDIRALLPGWADHDKGGLSDEERRLVASHLETCQDCRQVLKDLEQAASMVRALPPIGAPWSVEHRARELGHFHARRIATEAVLELTASREERLQASAIAPLARHGEVMDSAIHMAAPASRAQMAAPRANRPWVIGAVVVVVVAALAALAYWLLW